MHVIMHVEVGVDMLEILITLLACLCIVLVWVMLYDSNRFVVREYRAQDKRIRERTKAVVIADLHNKRYGRHNEKLLEAIEAQKPDMILIAGDILTASPGKSFAPAVEFLEALAGKYPVYYANGNHEHRLKLYPETYQDMAEKYGEALDKIGISPMINTHVTLRERGIAIYGLEIDRFYFKRFKVQNMPEEYLKELLGEPEKGLFTILLAHHPNYFPKYARWGADLVFSGHVHGGVVRVPFLGKGVISPDVRLFPKYDGGIFKEGAATMVLSRGLGIHTIPFRLFNPGELWAVTLEPGQEDRQDGDFSKAGSI